MDLIGTIPFLLLALAGGLPGGLGGRIAGRARWTDARGDGAEGRVTNDHTTRREGSET